MKKKLIVLFMSFVLGGSALFADSFHFLLQADCEIPNLIINYDKSLSFSFYPYPMPFLETNFQMPSKANERIYLGLKLLPTGLGGIAEISSRFGGIIKESKIWDNHNVELLAGFAAGAQIGLLDAVYIVPTFDMNFQAFLMPDNKGFYVGLGPNIKMMLDIYSSNFSFEAFISAMLCAGYKF